MSPVALGLALVMVALGATVQRTVGFGAALISVPLLLLIDTDLVPGPVVVANLALIGMMAIGTGGDADWRGVRWMALGLLPGALLGALALALVPEDQLAVLAGGIVLAAVVGVAVYGQVALRRRALWGGGAISGFMGTTAGVGGPPIALLYSAAPPDVMRATLCRVFLVNWVLVIATLTATGRLGVDEVRTGLVLMPGGYLGVLAGRWVSARVAADRMRTPVLVLSGATALVAIAQALL